MMAARLMRWLRAALLATLALCAGAAAQAHEISMAEMQLRETTRGEFLWQWTAGLRSGDDLRPVWPAHCRDEAGVLRCGAEGLNGRLGMDGVGKRFSAVLVKVFWIDGQSSVHTLTQGQREVQLFGSADDRRGMGEIASAYLVLGVDHILAGLDHLLFVIALLFLVGFQRRLVWTITAFTVAHSLTLALSALGLLTLRPPPVEATIALSILLVAGEALHQRPTLSRRWPALVAFLFGLVHGLGFAGALEQIGLPANHLPVALLTFNVGVEAGQLLVVLLAWALCAALARWPLAQRARRPVLYGIGGMAAYWTIGRVAGLLA
jgi:hydrogenase/urease accessory protein HupE